MNRDTDKYLKPVLDEVSEARKTSVSRFYKTDMYKGKSIEWLMNWYDNLASFIFSHPPNDNVSLVRVLLDQSGDGIIEVIYKYGNDKSKPSFRFEQ